MSGIDLSSFKGLYLATARDYINKLGEDLEILSKDPQNYNAINAIHISAHSLTTQAAVTGYKNIEAVCRIIEKTFKTIKGGYRTVPPKGRLYPVPPKEEGGAILYPPKGGTVQYLPKVPSELLYTLKDAIRGLSDCIDSIEKNDKEIDLSSIISQLERV